MKEKVHIFKLIDEYLFKQVELLKSSPATQKINEQLSVLTQNQQKYLNQFINIGILLTPLIVVSFIFFGNVSKKNEIETKQEIFDIINTYSSKKSEATRLSRDVISPKFIGTQKDLQRNLNAALSGAGVDFSKIELTFFDQTKPSSSLTQSRAQLRIQCFDHERSVRCLHCLAQRPESQNRKNEHFGCK